MIAVLAEAPSGSSLPDAVILVPLPSMPEVAFAFFGPLAAVTSSNELSIEFVSVLATLPAAPFVALPIFKSGSVLIFRWSATTVRRLDLTADPAALLLSLPELSWTTCRQEAA